MLFRGLSRGIRVAGGGPAGGLRCVFGLRIPATNIPMGAISDGGPVIASFVIGPFVATRRPSDGLRLAVGWPSDGLRLACGCPAGGLRGPAAAVVRLSYGRDRGP